MYDSQSIVFFTVLNIPFQTYVRIIDQTKNLESIWETLEILFPNEHFVV